MFEVYLTRYGKAFLWNLGVIPTHEFPKSSNCFRPTGFRHSEIVLKLSPFNYPRIADNH